MPRILTFRVLFRTRHQSAVVAARSEAFPAQRPPRQTWPPSEPHAATAHINHNASFLCGATQAEMIYFKRPLVRMIRVTCQMVTHSLRQASRRQLHPELHQSSSHPLTRRLQSGGVRSLGNRHRNCGYTFTLAYLWAICVGYFYVENTHSPESQCSSTHSEKTAVFLNVCFLWLTERW